MKIAVCAKQIPDPALDITYSEGLVSRPDEQVLDDTDRYGIEVALPVSYTHLTLPTTLVV